MARTNPIAMEIATSSNVRNRPMRRAGMLSTMVCQSMTVESWSSSHCGTCIAELMARANSICLRPPHAAAGAPFQRFQTEIGDDGQTEIKDRRHHEEGEWLLREPRRDCGLAGQF